MQNLKTYNDAVYGPSGKVDFDKILLSLKQRKNLSRLAKKSKVQLKDYEASELINYGLAESTVRKEKYITVKITAEGRAYNDKLLQQRIDKIGSSVLSIIAITISLISLIISILTFTANRA